MRGDAGSLAGLCVGLWGLPFLGSDPLGWSAGLCCAHGFGSRGSSGSLQSGSLRPPAARAPGLGPAGSSPRPHPGRAVGSVSASSVATARALQTAVGRADIFTVLPVSERLPRRLSSVSQGCPRAGLSPLQYFMEEEGVEEVGRVVLKESLLERSGFGVMEVLTR